ncbi:MULTISPECIES: hypothetical protein [unclassified Acinetobacter]|uniref:hypothetical protein n=1 Tax=unclassified Acinetobacter TaxID=196816 RepID=UPI002446DA71|nr:MULTISPECIES: hypothetical protein [unclassified Acinetobacter]MDH0032091.1 hypothetical protein [Acinetobacter sp. GD04021]MDH0887747.1 hypothetical protein [Acinetobacter sp. GD03873]MDH1084095.1 hypothetical protein [Acinetobacter sp. GD03983]MDH2190978.1 hypothetical protein [Acinetobacter sp. GD03645]MDH2204607.1 hypothetical protein [Acinetobacter sp. GD03647]
MSKVNRKGKLAQQSLDLYDPSVQQEQGGDLDFVLKIHDGHLQDLEISSVANLLSALGQIVGIKQASFKTIKEGSTTIAVTVPNNLKATAILNLTKDTSSISFMPLRMSVYKYGLMTLEQKVRRIVLLTMTR